MSRYPENADFRGSPYVVLPRRTYDACRAERNASLLDAADRYKEARDTFIRKLRTIDRTTHALNSVRLVEEHEKALNDAAGDTINYALLSADMEPVE